MKRAVLLLLLTLTTVVPPGFTQQVGKASITRPRVVTAMQVIEPIVLWRTHHPLSDI